MFIFIEFSMSSALLVHFLQGPHLRYSRESTSENRHSSGEDYCVTDKELLALRHFVEYYRQYLLGRKFLVRTDHQALVWLFVKCSFGTLLARTTLEIFKGIYIGTQTFFRRGTS
jgi:hypothetical protein